MEPRYFFGFFRLRLIDWSDTRYQKEAAALVLPALQLLRGLCMTSPKAVAKETMPDGGRMLISLLSEEALLQAAAASGDSEKDMGMHRAPQWRQAVAAAAGAILCHLLLHESAEGETM
eukprot:COSAG05_NODE_1303_length_5240_cov_2.158335_7_plen_118_part_00